MGKKAGQAEVGAEDFLFVLRLQGVPAPEREYRFCPGRRWRFDFAWPEVKVYVEVEGGTFVGGRHVRPIGYARDCEKYNAATLLGWAGLRFTTDMLTKDPFGCAALVRDLLSERGLEPEEEGYPVPADRPSPAEPDETKPGQARKKGGGEKRGGRGK